MRMAKENWKNDKNESSRRDRLKKGLHFIW